MTSQTIVWLPEVQTPVKLRVLWQLSQEKPRCHEEVWYPRPACKCPYHSGQAPLKLQYCPFQVQGFQGKSTLQQTPQVMWPAGHLGPAAENHIQHGAVLGTPVSSSYTRRDGRSPRMRSSRSTVPWQVKSSENVAQNYSEWHPSQTYLNNLFER